MKAREVSRHVPPTNPNQSEDIRDSNLVRKFETCGVKYNHGMPNIGYIVEVLVISELREKGLKPVANTDLWINLGTPYLGATPDAILYSQNDKPKRFLN